MLGKRYILIMLLGLTLADMPVTGQVSLSGFIKNFSVLYEYPGKNLLTFWNLPDHHEYGSVNQRFRLTATDRLSPSLAVETACELSFRIQDPALFHSFMFSIASDPLLYRVSNADPLLYPPEIKPDGSFGIFTNLDRLNVTWSPKPGDIIIGRQALAWGSARVINPTDVIAPFSFNALDTEDRPGVDVLRMRVPTGQHGEIDLGYVFGKNWKFKQSAFFLRAKSYWLKSDVSLLLIGFRENALLGFDLARSVGGASVWFEAAQVWTGLLNSSLSPQAEKYFRLSTGMDYSLSSTLYGLIEYHFNGAGEYTPEKYLRDISKTAYTEGSVYLMARHYLAPGLVYQLSPLTVLNFQMLWNLTDFSVYQAISLEYNIAQNIYLTAGAFIGAGEGPGRYGPGSEFGIYPNIYYTSFRIYL